jgi:hypothetical protein
MDAPISLKAERMLRDPSKARLLADAIRTARKAGAISAPFEIRGEKHTVSLVDSKSLPNKSRD